jgi:hypothetical protein
MAHMPTPLFPPRTESEIAAHTAHLAGDVVLPHPLAQAFSYTTVEALLAVARQDPGIDQGAARRLVQQALTAIVEVEILASRMAP